ncbi:MAG TPA: RNA methyltransferase [Abditibacteriaceae bacterium]
MIAENTASEVQTIHSLDDACLAGYRNVRERDLRAEGVFIAEGALLVERLLRSRFPVESIFVSKESKAHISPDTLKGVPIYLADSELMRQIIGFDFHRGVLALGKRLPFPEVQVLIEHIAAQAPLQLLTCPSTETAENLGLILRSASAFGVGGVLLPTEGADPLSRRCLRQSMGSALSLPIARCADLLHELCVLRENFGVQLVAAVADTNAIPLSDFVWPSRSVLVVGNEFQGLDAAWLEACDHRVTIPIAPDCDSLNVATATGILLYHRATARK